MATKGRVTMLVPSPNPAANPAVVPVLGQLKETDDSYNNPSGAPYTFTIPDGLADPNAAGVITENAKADFEIGPGRTAHTVSLVR